MTALSAYRELEAMGLVEAVPRSGFRVRARPSSAGEPRPRQGLRIVSPSAQRDEIVAEILSAVADPTLEPLGLGCPTPDHFPLTSLRRLTGQLLSEKPELWACHSPSPGHPELRRHIAARLRLRGLDVGADDVLLTSGASEALSLALRATVRQDDVALVACPTYFGILDAARAAGARVLEVPEDGNGMTPDAVARALSRHAARVAVFVPSHGNPSGSVMNAENRAAVVRSFLRHGVTLIEDDLYAELGFDGRRTAPMSTLARASGVPWILVSSFSKSLAPGGRVGYLVASRPLLVRLTALKRASTLANATLPEALVATYLRGGRYDTHLRRLNLCFARRMEDLSRSVQAHFPRGTRVSRPRGGFFLWLELPEGHDGLRLFHLAREHRISIAPGPIFSLGRGLERFVRLNGGATLRRASTLETLGQLAHRARAG
jgi:DNA-binding transcriptional MocR family regulator